MLGFGALVFSPDSWLDDYLLVSSSNDRQYIYRMFAVATSLGIIADIAVLTSTFYIAPSLSEVLTSASKLVIVAILAKFCRGHAYTKMHFFGVSLIFMAVIILAFVDPSDSYDTLSIVLAAIVAPLCIALRWLISEILAHDYGVPVFYSLFLTGVIGLPISALLLGVYDLIPGQDCGNFENFVDTASKLAGTVGTWGTCLLLWLLLIMLALLTVGREFGGTALILLSTGLDRAVWDFNRGLVTWVTDVLIYYCGGKNVGLGEEVLIVVRFVPVHNNANNILVWMFRYRLIRYFWRLVMQLESLVSGYTCGLLMFDLHRKIWRL